MSQKNIVKTDELSAWYLKNLEEAKVCDYAPVRGCMIIRPYGFAIWEIIRDELDRRIKKAGVDNAYFPLFIPMSFLDKEKDHVEGFAPELAVVTHGGGEELAEPLVVRPTSETIIYDSFSRWIKSYKDLPLKINQWANVVRWEKRTRPFLRTTEFLWQEGHTAHINEAEALQTSLEHLEIYTTFLRDYLAIPVYSGKKVDSERFAGAKHTFTMEAMMPDGKALQLGTSHLLGHSFPASFNIKFQDENGDMVVPWCTSWGVTTRTIGALLMMHGDDKGFVLPPKVAPIQVAIVPILRKGVDQEKLLSFAQIIYDQLRGAGIRAKVMFAPDKSPGAQFFALEQLGIPVRLEIGQREMDANSVVMATRIGLDGQPASKTTESLDQIVVVTSKALNAIQAHLLQGSQEFQNEHTFAAATLADLEKGLNDNPGFYKVSWCGGNSCEAELKPRQATFRVILSESHSGKCFVCQQDSSLLVIAGKSY